jgi:hypothetical protein
MKDKAGDLGQVLVLLLLIIRNGGLNLFHRDNGTFTHYMHDPEDPQSLIANKVRAIFEDSYGNFWWHRRRWVTYHGQKNRKVYTDTLTTLLIRTS